MASGCQGCEMGWMSQRHHECLQRDNENESLISPLTASNDTADGDIKATKSVSSKPENEESERCCLNDPESGHRGRRPSPS